MIIPFTDSIGATPIYINPRYVLSVRPDPTDPNRITLVKLEDGETIRLQGAHSEVAERRAKAA